MKRLSGTALLLLVGLALPAGARGADPWLLFDGCRWTLPGLCAEWRARQCWCPDDYGPKALPCVPPNARGCVDDYCPKPLPCVAPGPAGCVDDYCPKTCPLFLGSLCAPWYRCGPSCPACPPKP